MRDVLGCFPAQDAILMAAGLDSLGAEELHCLLTPLGSITLPAHVFFVAYPSTNALVAYFESRRTRRWWKQPAAFVAALVLCLIAPTLPSKLFSGSLLIAAGLRARHTIPRGEVKQSTTAAAAAASSALPSALTTSYELAQIRRDLEVVVSVEQLERARTVGVGSYGTVVLVRHTETHTPFALKCLSRARLVRSGQQNAVQRERAVMADIFHPFCARLVRTFKDGHSVYLLLEWCPGGELLRHLPLTGGGLAEPTSRFYTSCCILALEHLHALGVIYRDLKPEHCLLDARGFLKLCDFGFAKRVPQGGVTHTMCGTPHFMAPEVIRCTGHGRMADVWSTGVLLYELAVGRPPFAERGAPATNIYAAVLAHRFPLATTGLSVTLDSLLSALLHEDADSRLGSRDWGEVKAHPWFTDLDWAALEQRELKPPFEPYTSGELDTRHFDHFQEPDEEQERASNLADLFGDWDRDF